MFVSLLTIKDIKYVQHLLILVTVEKKITGGHSARYLTPDFHFITQIAMQTVFSVEVHLYKI